MIYAIIKNSAVENIISLDNRALPDFPNAVACSEKPVAIGDVYADGRFYRNGEEVLSETDRLRLELADARSALDAIYGGVTDE